MVLHLVTMGSCISKLDRILTEVYLALFQALNFKKRTIFHRQQWWQNCQILCSMVLYLTIKMMMADPSAVEELKYSLQEYEIRTAWFYIPMDTCMLLIMDQILATVSNVSIALRLW